MTNNIYGADYGLFAPRQDAGGAPDWVSNYSAQHYSRPDFTAVAWGLPADIEPPPGMAGNYYPAPAFTVPLGPPPFWRAGVPAGAGADAGFGRYGPGPDAGFIGSQIGWGSPQGFQPGQPFQPPVALYRPDPTQVFNFNSPNFYQSSRWQNRQALDPSFLPGQMPTPFPGAGDPSLTGQFGPGFNQPYPGFSPVRQPYSSIPYRSCCPQNRWTPENNHRPFQFRPPFRPGGDAPQPVKPPAGGNGNRIGMGYFITRDGQQFTQDYTNGQIQPYAPLPFETDANGNR